jgi:hypothetical protein
VTWLIEIFDSGPAPLRLLAGDSMAAVNLLVAAVPGLLLVADAPARVAETLLVAGPRNAVIAAIVPGVLFARTMTWTVAVVTALSTGIEAEAPSPPMVMTVICAKVCSQYEQRSKWNDSDLLTETPPPPHHEDDLDTADLAD